MDGYALPPLRTDSKNWGPNTLPLLGLGNTSLVFRLGDDRVVKIPKTYPEENYPNGPYVNEANIEAVKNEARVYYARLGHHERILRYYRATELAIELDFANQGDLRKYIEQNPPPAEKLRAEWIRNLADTFAYIHSRRVVVDDIHPGNVLIHNNCLKLSDFDLGLILPLDTDMESFSTGGMTPQIEILHLGCLFYNIATWSLKFRYHYIDEERFPRLGELPSIDDVLGGMIIWKCWTRGYSSMESLRTEVKKLLH